MDPPNLHHGKCFKVTCPDISINIGPPKMFDSSKIQNFIPNKTSKKNHSNSCSSKKKTPVLHISTPFLGTPSPRVVLPRREGVLPGRHATEIHALEAGALQLNRVAIVAGPGMSWMAKQQVVQNPGVEPMVILW